MKEIISRSRLIALCVIAMCFAAAAFARGGKQDFVLHNETGVEIHELYVSPHSSGEWGEDVLGRDTLAGRRKREDHFRRSRKEREVGPEGCRRKKKHKKKGKTPTYKKN